MAEAPAQPSDPDGMDGLDGRLYPAAGPDTLALADLGAVTLTPSSIPNDSGTTLSVATVDNDVRSMLLATSTLQALGGALLAALA